MASFEVNSDIGEDDFRCGDFLREIDDAILCVYLVDKFVSKI